VLIDAKTLSGGPTISADVCIVGAGPAGIVLTGELAARGFTVALVESGGVEDDAEAHSLDTAIVIGGEYTDPIWIRCRGFGGTSRMWNTLIDGKPFAKFVPLDPIDFQQRDWLPHSGWPFQFAHLAPYYERAHQLCGLGPFRYGAADWNEPGASAWNTPGGPIHSAVYQLAPATLYSKVALDDVRTSEKIQCLLHATVTEIDIHPDGRKITGIKIGTLCGAKACVTASIFVLAAGGIENARLLLASNRVCTAGIGNQNDLVGRYLMDHPVCHFTQMFVTNRRVFDESDFYDLHQVRGIPVLGRLALDEEILEREKILNSSIVVYPRPPRYRSAGLEAVRRLKAARTEGAAAGAMLRDAGTVLLNLPDIVAYALHADPAHIFDQHYWSRPENNADRYVTFEPQFYVEQAPEPENRIKLSSERDRLGMAKSEIHWRWGSFDQRSVERTREIFDAELRRLGLGKMEVLGSRRFVPSAHHPAGTTRMHVDPRRGVVDENCRVHEIENLFIAGASVYPTCGYANPMLTIVAMSLRLADHLARAKTP